MTGLIAGGSIVLGAILGATSSGMGIMLSSRVIEALARAYGRARACARMRPFAKRQHRVRSMT